MPYTRRNMSVTGGHGWWRRKMPLHRHGGHFPTSSTPCCRGAVRPEWRRSPGQCCLCPSVQRRSSATTPRFGWGTDVGIKVRVLNPTCHTALSHPGTLQVLLFDCRFVHRVISHRFQWSWRARFTPNSPCQVPADTTTPGRRGITLLSS